MSNPPRPIDHCVLPTADLAIARERLALLGFTVAPDGVHPFGTANCCVYLADGTFLEPLAMADPAAARLAAAGGNVFVARDRAWRERGGADGFSALVFGSDNADADHAAFVRAGISAGDRLDFSRPFVDASGRSDAASFSLAFAADERAPDAFFFTCQRVNAPAVDRSALQRHDNGVERIRAVVLEASEPAAFSAFMQEVVGAPARPVGDGLVFAAPNGDVLIRRSRAAEASPKNGLVLTDIVFGVGDADRLAALFEARGVAFEARGGALQVRPAPGQGATFIFEESR